LAIACLLVGPARRSRAALSSLVAPDQHAAAGGLRAVAPGRASDPVFQGLNRACRDCTAQD